MIFTVRKRPKCMVSKANRERQANKGAIYVPGGFINSRVRVLLLSEYQELKRKADLFETIQKISEET